VERQPQQLQSHARRRQTAAAAITTLHYTPQATPRCYASSATMLPRRRFHRLRLLAPLIWFMEARRTSCPAQVQIRRHERRQMPSHAAYGTLRIDSETRKAEEKRWRYVVIISECHLYMSDASPCWHASRLHVAAAALYYRYVFARKAITSLSLHASHMITTTAHFIQAVMPGTDAASCRSECRVATPPVTAPDDATLVTPPLIIHHV